MKKVLVIGPHPDDMEFGCAGTLYKFYKNKYQINLLVISKGEYGGDASVREKEQEKTAKFLKANLYWGGLKDTEISFGRKLIDIIESKISLIKPDIVMTNYYEDTHQDHVAVSKATITAARYISNLIFYECPTTLNFFPNIFSNIEKQLNIKFKMLKFHKSQVYKTRVKNLSIIESARSTAIFRGYQARVKYAEAFVAQRLSLDYLWF